MKCSFCKKDQTKVQQIIAASDKIGICDNCIMQCLDILVYGEAEPMIINLDEEEEPNASTQADGGC